MTDSKCRYNNLNRVVVPILNYVALYVAPIKQRVGDNMLEEHKYPYGRLAMVEGEEVLERFTPYLVESVRQVINTYEPQEQWEKGTTIKRVLMDVETNGEHVYFDDTNTRANDKVVYQNKDWFYTELEKMERATVRKYKRKFYNEDGVRFMYDTLGNEKAVRWLSFRFATAEERERFELPSWTKELDKHYLYGKLEEYSYNKSIPVKVDHIGVQGMTPYLTAKVYEVRERTTADEFINTGNVYRKQYVRYETPEGTTYYYDNTTQLVQPLTKEKYGELNEKVSVFVERVSYEQNYYQLDGAKLMVKITGEAMIYARDGRLMFDSFKQKQDFSYPEWLVADRYGWEKKLFGSTSKEV